MNHPDGERPTATVGVIAEGSPGGGDSIKTTWTRIGLSTLKVHENDGASLRT